MISRGLVVTGITFFAWVLCIVATALPTHTDLVVVKVSCSIWRCCVTTMSTNTKECYHIPNGETPCHHNVRGMQACSVLSIVTGLLVMVFGVAAHLRKLPAAARSSQKFLATALCGIFTTWCLVTWAIQAYDAHHASCTSGIADAGKLPRSAAVAIVAWILGIIVTIFSSPLVLPTKLTDWEQAIEGGEVHTLVE